MASIIRLSEGANLALHATMLLAKTPTQSQDTAHLAARIGASGAHLSKVLQRLQHAGIVKSIRGPKGGFALAHEPGQITLLDICEVIEGPIEVRTCLLERPICGAGQCIFGTFLGSATREFRDLLKRTTLAKVTRRDGKPEPVKQRKPVTAPRAGRSGKGARDRAA